MEPIINYLFQIGFSFSIFILISLGLAVIFGMMRIINLAQGEFLMLGAYFCTICTQSGINLWLSIIIAALAVGICGIIIERLLIQWLYGRILDTLLATWGLSLLLVGAITTIFGPQTESIASPLGNVALGELLIPIYGIFMIATSLVLLLLLYLLWRHTRFGLIVRSTMQNSGAASTLGINQNLVYMLTFGFGCMLTGFAGAILVPIVGAYPTLGLVYIAKSFVTVISGGSLPLLGTISASSLFGTIDGVIATISTSVIGEIVVLFVAIILLRMLPLGITGRMTKGV
ncbi:MAG: branched-chain amino acid ABC transporter permease [Rhodospirillaceae bacterium]|nr:branched-chain amino acid ABC transporter permease [Rhodospirillaceae bacterium]